MQKFNQVFPNVLSMSVLNLAQVSVTLSTSVSNT